MWTEAQPLLGWRNHIATAATRRRLNGLGGFRRALCTGRIVVHFQPIVSADDLHVCGAEALVRWQHPGLGLLPPGAFIHTVERTGMIAPLTRHVLERSVAECAAWRRRGREMSVAVNLSARNLLDRDLPREVGRVLSHYGLCPGALQLEITESMLMSDSDRALSIVTRLKDLGVRLAVDDFGTGYSSLSNLKRLPIDELKIDRSFVSPMTRDQSDRIIVRSTIELAHDLGLEVVAEGVEDEATLRQLARMRCDLVQGYHVSAPMPSDAFGRWLGAWRHAAPPPVGGKAERETSWTPWLPLEPDPGVRKGTGDVGHLPPRAPAPVPAAGNVEL